jgi:hypothetical protein
VNSPENTSDALSGADRLKKVYAVDRDATALANKCDCSSISEAIMQFREQAF